MSVKQHPSARRLRFQEQGKAKKAAKLAEQQQTTWEVAVAIQKARLEAKRKKTR